ncbi:reticulocyte-binding protein homolog 2a-like [Hydractinia symbiolongicarpus]|uniref:reticulocyte-binding protein homolog 2a-like n=1 Tax=Hydractinia symbiolongicarpus TaxID=13093 RepID=UPI00254CF1FE|nr:reticulocyte-binding protein homolog 2a-like [Hydractinia symbiolongicarpus]
MEEAGMIKFIDQYKGMFSKEIPTKIVWLSPFNDGHTRPEKSLEIPYCDSYKPVRPRSAYININSKMVDQLEHENLIDILKSLERRTGNAPVRHHQNLEVSLLNSLHDIYDDQKPKVVTLKVKHNKFKTQKEAWAVNVEQDKPHKGKKRDNVYYHNNFWPNDIHYSSREESRPEQFMSIINTIENSNRSIQDTMRYINKPGNELLKRYSPIPVTNIEFQESLHQKRFTERKRACRSAPVNRDLFYVKRYQESLARYQNFCLQPIKTPFLTPQQGVNKENVNCMHEGEIYSLSQIQNHQHEVEFSVPPSQETSKGERNYEFNLLHGPAVVDNKNSSIHQNNDFGRNDTSKKVNIIESDDTEKNDDDPSINRIADKNGSVSYRNGIDRNNNNFSLNINKRGDTMINDDVLNDILDKNDHVSKSTSINFQKQVKHKQHHPAAHNGADNESETHHNDFINKRPEISIFISEDETQSQYSSSLPINLTQSAQYDLDGKEVLFIENLDSDNFASETHQTEGNRTQLVRTKLEKNVLPAKSESDNSAELEQEDAVTLQKFNIDTRLMKSSQEEGMPTISSKNANNSPNVKNDLTRLLNSSGQPTSTTLSRPVSSNGLLTESARSISLRDLSKISLEQPGSPAQRKKSSTRRIKSANSQAKKASKQNRSISKSARKGNVSTVEKGLAMERKLDEEKLRYLNEEEENHKKESEELQGEEKLLLENKKQMEDSSELLKQKEMELKIALEEKKKNTVEERKRRRAEEAEKRRLEVARRREEKRLADIELAKKNEELQNLAREEREKAEVLQAELDRLKEEDKRREEEEKLLENEREKERQKEKVRMAAEAAAREEAELKRLQEERLEREELLKQAELKLKLLQMEKERQEEIKRMELLRIEEEKNLLKRREQERLAEEERKRIEAQRLEEEALTNAMLEIERKRAALLSRRANNIEKRRSLSASKRNQLLTRSRTFSYFVKVPREVWELPIGWQKKPKYKAGGGKFKVS